MSSDRKGKGKKKGKQRSWCEGQGGEKPSSYTEERGKRKGEGHHFFLYTPRKKGGGGGFQVFLIIGKERGRGPAPADDGERRGRVFFFVGGKKGGRKARSGL